MRNRLKKYRGITLIESVLYLGLFAITFTTIMQFYFSTGNSNIRSAENFRIQRTRIYLVEHLDTTFEEAVSVDVANSTFDDDDGVVRLNVGAGYVQYQINSDGQIEVTDGTNTDPLTPPSLNVSKFRIDRSTSGTSSLDFLEFSIDVEADNIAGLDTTISVDYFK